MKAGTRSTILGVGSVVAVLVLWEIAGRYWTNPLFLPPLSAIWERFLEFVDKGQLAADISASAQSYLGGLGFAILIGVSVGIAMASSKAIQDILNPWVSILNATPTIALAPIFILIFGLGIESKIAVCTLVMLFPILVNTYAGFSNTNEDLVETIRAFGASHVQAYLKVKLPMALPYLFAALRLAAAHGLVGVVVSELFGAKNGVGLLILNSAHTFDSPGLFAGILMLAIAGVVITYSLLALEKRLFRWRRSEGGE
ncbi:ABC transporter permease [Glutamicibacter nicotianae]